MNDLPRKSRSREKSKIVVISVTPSKLETIDTYCVSINMSRSEFMTELALRYIEGKLSNLDI